MRTKGLLRNIAEEVRVRRKSKDLSQEALADLAGVHRNVVYRLESGKYNPTVLTLHAVAVKLDVPLHELLTAAAKRA